MMSIAVLRRVIRTGCTPPAVYGAGPGIARTASRLKIDDKLINEVAQKIGVVGEVFDVLL
jgi:hypothetical protein